MLTVKESIEKIKPEFVGWFGSDITDIRLEELEEYGENYNLTISFLMPNRNAATPLTSAMIALTSPYIRQYKDVIVNREDGKIIKVKMH